MTFSPLPANPATLLAHLDDAGLAAHALAALRLLAARGVDLPQLVIDEIEEVEIECVARIPGALARHPRAAALLTANDAAHTPSA